ncbi:MAG: DNA polymerase III delta prime subunit [uncultured Solirubrobacterales bacterium]|uniref:DNA polymerase III delta prime subunit n=1 Tax=uncultured Solirubrobacterales bacterium TaxID=768556 RepID=A0A6J4S5K5_9ACTN|nr:MAG: DNA polymerase III delta prime subunit [uncultured Solirubrobacterales bacterium]
MSSSTPAAAASLPGTFDQPHARLVLATATGSGAQPSHAYLLHGPAGTGKRTAAASLAAELLADGAPDHEDAHRRALGGTHPDLTWVRPTGAHVMRVGDVDEPVVAAASRTPFESKRRVFVLERVETMNDEVANRLLKTLEEPAPFVHLILLSESLGQVLETVVSRCQLVRFDPLAPERIAAALEADGVPGPRAAACGRLALGDGSRARYLASEEGESLRAEVEDWVLGVVEGTAPGAQSAEPWRGLLERAEARRGQAEQAVEAAAARRLESEPKGRERRAIEREFEEAAKRDGRRARTEVLDLGLTLAALVLRDLGCLAAGAEGAVLAVDRLERLASVAGETDERVFRAAVERCEETRASLELNVTEELALAALGFRLEGLVGAAE